ncbi:MULTISPECIES: aldo/keto reductase [Dickeya]|uniref:Aldo/keto reductase n=1 Tax=Dickeya chrysanthemi TaxID=556 RepID=A0ABU8JK30_DICCH|nr:MULTISPECIES: aldo/keto reductase [Dickeya]MBX9446017.1 aldo/keto reductase [Dickeya chrysanthemi]MCA7008517.1 aldo/keto reductase [Dickeya chrysanthemi]TYL44107.1 aldo/keto reductase [Dickeya sp. ws52]
MERREFLKFAAGSAALVATGSVLAQSGKVGEAIASFIPENVQGTVLPTRGKIARTLLPLNEVAAPGIRYRTPFRFGMGGTQIGNIFAPISDAQAQATLQAAWDGGVRYYDTSPFYGHGLSEHRLGAFLRDKPRDQYLISTKVGRVFHPSRQPLPASLWADKLNFAYDYDYTAAGARRSVEDSLQRLGLASIDIVYIHDLGPDNTELSVPWTTFFETARYGAMAELEKMRKEGLIKAWGFGINRPDAAVMAAALDGPTPDIVLLACQYSLIDHEDTVTKTFPALAKKGITVTVGTPLNDGFLGGRNRYHFSTQLPPGVVEKRARLATIADRHGIDIRTAALQFAAAPSIVSAIIPGARTPEQVKANIQSMKVSIPRAFWDELREQKLITADAPVPT